MPARGYKSFPTAYQLAVHNVYGYCNADGVPVSTDEGKAEVTTAKTATGTYTLTMKTPFKRAMLYCTVVPETADLTFKVTISGSVATVIFANLSSTDTDTVFRYHIVGSDDIVKRG